MPRMGRVVLPNYPHHVVQRGHNRQVVFAEETDFRRYLDDVRELKTIFDIRVHAYCLMTNHVHLLRSPGEAITGLGQMMKALAARATRYRNQLEGRSGTLWECRYKSSPVQTGRYPLACTRYIEINPVHAATVSEADGYMWSSFRQRMGIDADNWIDYHPCYLGLGETTSERRQRYPQFVYDGTPDKEICLIRQALQRGQLTGNNRFIDEVEKIMGRRVES